MPAGLERPVSTGFSAQRGCKLANVLNKGCGGAKQLGQDAAHGRQQQTRSSGAAAAQRASRVHGYAAAVSRSARAWLPRRRCRPSRRRSRPPPVLLQDGAAAQPLSPAVAGCGRLGSSRGQQVRTLGPNKVTGLCGVSQATWHRMSPHLLQAASQLQHSRTSHSGWHRRATVSEKQVGAGGLEAGGAVAPTAVAWRRCLLPPAQTSLPAAGCLPFAPLLAGTLTSPPCERPSLAITSAAQP